MTPRNINLGYMSMRHATLPERAAAAAQAGFNGISLRADRWHDMRADGWDVPRVRALLDAHGLVVSEIEPMRFLRDELLDAVVEMVHGFQVPRVQVTPPIDGTAVPLDKVAPWLKNASAALPQTQLAIEFLPPTNVPDAATAQRLIDMAGGAPNLGLCVDSWHVFRGGGLASLQGVDPARVFMVQIDDGKMQPKLQDYIQDCLLYRLPCGEGEFDLTAFMQMLPESAPINVEVINEALDKRPPMEVAALLYKTTVSMLERCAQHRGHTELNQKPEKKWQI